MNNNCIEIKNLNYQNIFNNFSICFKNNKFITITGPNNCGKTTLLRIIDRKLSTNNTIVVYEKKLEDYKITELNTIIKTVIPLEITFTQSRIEDELYYQLSVDLLTEEKKKRLKLIIKRFKLTKLLNKQHKELTMDEIVRVQLALAIINSPKILLLDDLNKYFNKNDLLEIISTLKTISKEDKLTIIMATTNLECSINTDYIYVINNSEVILEGEPLSVLEKDNILNKVGLELPFMVDLSVKLRDYDLIKQLELDMERMADILWN